MLTGRVTAGREAVVSIVVLGRRRVASRRERKSMIGPRLLAASYHRAGVERLATTDWRDFARYGVFKLERL